MLTRLFLLIAIAMTIASSFGSTSRLNVGSKGATGLKSMKMIQSDKAMKIRAGSNARGLISGTIQGLKDRAAYDSKFKTKLAVELCVGFVTQLIAEYAKRGAKTMAEIDFVIADLVMGLSANFFAVYLSAPVLQTSKAPSSSTKETKLATFLKGCPDNSFQKCSPGSSYSILQRVFAMLNVAPKLFVIGFIAMALGTGFTTALSLTRTLIESGGKLTGPALLSKSTLDGVVDLLKNSVAIGVYLAVSTNLRYQVVAGIFESRIIDPLFSKFPFIQALGSFLIRTANTYVGSAMMVDFLRLMGQQH